MATMLLNGVWPNKGGGGGGAFFYIEFILRGKTNTQRFKNCLKKYDWSVELLICTVMLLCFALLKY